MVKRLALIALLAVAVLMLAGCTLNTAPLLGLPCTVGPVVLDKGASTRLTRGEKEQVRTVNESGAAVCGWKPPKK